MTPSTHEDDLSHLSSQLIIHANNPLFWGPFCTYGAELAALMDISLDPVSDALAALYCPTGNGAPKDASAMLRSWLLMTYRREGSPTAWATRLKTGRYDVVELPLIRYTALPVPADVDPTDFDWVLFTSPQGVRSFRAAGLPTGDARMAALSGGTAAAISMSDSNDTSWS